MSYLDGRHRREFDQEMDIDRDLSKQKDELVHCCLCKSKDTKKQKLHTTVY